jgi:hypothetical protein
VARSSLPVALLAAGLLAAGCASAPRAPAQSEPSASVPPVTAPADDDLIDVRVDAAGTSVLLVTDVDPPRRLATVPAAAGEVVHTAVRPGRTDPLTVLVLVRRDDPVLGICYELRYAVDVGQERLEDLPRHLQVDTGTATVLDVPPVPVWAPDGSALAWVDWNPLGTQLRALGWEDEDGRTGPADEAVAYRLAEVPPGVQLDGWEGEADGDLVLTGQRDGERWRIAVEHEPRRVALARTSARRPRTGRRALTDLAQP